MRHVLAALLVGLIALASGPPSARANPTEEQLAAILRIAEAEKDASRRVEAIADVARLYARAGRLTRALELLKRLSGPPAGQPTTGDMKEIALRSLVWGGKHSEAMKLASTIGANKLFEVQLVAARELLGAGRIKEAAALLGPTRLQGKRLVHGEGRRALHGNALGFADDLLELQFKAGLKEQAARMLAALAPIHKADLKSVAGLSHAASAEARGGAARGAILAAGGRADEAKAAFKAAVAAAARVTEASERADVLVVLARRQRLAGSPADAADALDQAVKAASGLGTRAGDYGLGLELGLAGRAEQMIAGLAGDAVAREIEAKMLFPRLIRRGGTDAAAKLVDALGKLGAARYPRPDANKVWPAWLVMARGVVASHKGEGGPAVARFREALELTRGGGEFELRMLEDLVEHLELAAAKLDVKPLLGEAWARIVAALLATAPDAGMLPSQRLGLLTAGLIANDVGTWSGRVLD